MIKNEKVYKPFMCYCAKVIPLAFNESMSYYECICNITNHINNEIIPVVNENSDIVNQNKKDFDELKEYVDDNMLTKDVNDLTYYTLTSDLSSVATSGDYDDLLNKPTIPTVPTNVSSFNNDAGYITKNVNDLTNYTTTTSLTSLLSNKEDLITYGSNTNGEYYKFASGLLICTKTASVTTSITTAWGSLYESSEAIDLGSFPMNFIATPVINGNVTSQRSAFIESIYNSSTSSWGYTYLVRPSSSGSNTYQVSLMAIGKWK